MPAVFGAQSLRAEAVTFQREFPLRPSPLHEALATIAHSKLFVTTAHDTCFEDVFEKNAASQEPVILAVPLPLPRRWSATILRFLSRFPRWEPSSNHVCFLATLAS
jgi:hypothetical protein